MVLMCAIRGLAVLRPVLGKGTSFLPLRQTRKVTIKPVIKPHDEAELSFIEKNKRARRPISPHLSIYKVQMTTLLSISHRISGIAFTAYAVTLGAVYFCPYSAEEMAKSIRDLNIPSPIGFAIKTVLAFPVSYHIANGVRHLIWDSGKLLTNKGVITTGYFVLVTTALLSLALANM